MTKEQILELLPIHPLAEGFAQVVIEVAGTDDADQLRFVQWLRSDPEGMALTAAIVLGEIV